MRVLVACEFSGIVRDAFIRRGHDAISLDLLPSERPGPHIQGDLRDHLNDGFDIMIAHPPCRYLASSGARWWKDKRPEQEEAIKFFIKIAESDARMIAVENPIGILSTFYRKPDQIIQPWMFGHPTTKATCLWLHGLPKLIPTNIVKPTRHDVWKEPPGPDRWKNRSRTYQGIADAMAAQWGPLS